MIQAAGDTVATHATEGFLTGTLTASGGFSGKVSIDGVTQAFGAVFYGDGVPVFTVGGKKQGSLVFGGKTLSLAFDGGVITAVLTQGDDASEGTATRAIYSTANKVPAELLNSASKGFYTVSLPAKVQTPAMDVATYPQGHGFATLSLSNAGAVTFAGTLADGSGMTASSAVVAGDTSPIFVPLPTPGAAAAIKGGSISGVLAFDSTQVDSDVTGSDWLWFRPAAVGTAAVTNLYTNGWPGGIRVDAVGALYNSAVKVQMGLGLGGVDAVNGNGRLQFSDGRLTAVILKTNFNINGNSVVKIPAGDGSFTLTLAPGTGGFSGTFAPNWASPAAVKPTFKGVILQKGGNRGGFGFFISNVKGDVDPESGGVVLSGQE